ncbi:flagellar biosynthetic protein FliR [Algicella marina]|uniref:Type III secretion protein n=1 Tax=Algicella marina TaxID=2683284 RepID=A0A6P1T4M9_9RHOB|nr:flagellar biosynthetic protein FliR [Algicella marina]QHQ36456.1 type III secretion protein [Algicella marina]
MFDMVASLLDFSEAALLAAILTFVRVAAIVGLLPGFGEQFVPVRIRLAAALAFALVIFPMLDRSALTGGWTMVRFGGAILTEAAVGLLIGLGFRLLVMALQLAGSIAAQTTALAQIAGSGVAPDPMPALGNALVLAGLALAMVLDLHLKAIEAMLISYDLIGFGGSLPAGDVAAWGLAHAVRAFALAFSLAAPFVIAAFLYNVAIGAINRAMPQLMVAFVGAPAITAATLVLLLLAAPLILGVWSGHLDRALALPLGMPR